MIQKIKEKIKLLFFEEVEEDQIISFKDELKNFFKSPREIISFFAPIIFALILIIPVPYTITVGGGTINIDNKITIENSIKDKGSFNSAYVKELKGRIITYIIAKINPDYELVPLKESTFDNETEKEYIYRERTYFTSSLESATFLAYKQAGKEIRIEDEKLFVLYILEEAETNLKVQDEIISVENNKINNMDDLVKVIDMYNINDTLNIKVLRNGKEVDCTIKIKNIDNKKKIGIYLNTSYIYETNPKIEFDFTNKEAGPSGGLMIALSIYNKLVDEDITNGKKIVGTGTIDIDGTVGEIGGVAEKLAGAVESKADIFIFPQENYEEALAIKKKLNYNIELINVSTFEETLKKLEEAS